MNTGLAGIFYDWMESHLTVDQVRGAQFRTVLRGLDRVEVEAFIQTVADRIEELEVEQQRLADEIGDTGRKDLESEFDAIGSEVGRILQVAREAAEAMRERASLDAARWRGEAMADSEDARRLAAADAEAMRRDAWATGTELLKQAVAESTREREQAERDVLTVMGEAEREAHRLTSGARREAEDVVRAAAMDAEKMTSEAVKRRDDIIDAATRQAAAAQERTRALEQRRDELLEELENVRSTLTRLEGSLEEKRDSLDLSASEGTTVRVVPSRPPVIEEDGKLITWEPGETVRVVTSEKAARPEPAKPASRQAERGEVVAEPKPPTVAPAPTVDEPPSQEVDSDKTEAPPSAPSVADDVEALFASLRGGAEDDDSSVSVEPSPREGEPAPSPRKDRRDWIDVRDERLLPITNRALRGAKKSITELQNIALDSLRTDDSWRPDAGAVSDALRAELIAVWSESFAAGHTVAEEMTGSKLKRPPTPPSEGVDGFAAHLVDAVVSALDEAGEGQRERQSAASRVFRVWRADEAERRIREVAIHAYEMGVELSAATTAVAD